MSREDATSEGIETPERCFQGYPLRSDGFYTTLSHFYRGELGRANTWRTRLDVTTNWAVITVGAALTFTFGSPVNPHFVLLLVLLLVLTFLFTEARRYRYYELWYYRVHLLETDFFAGLLSPPFCPSPDWGERLADSLLQPVFPITWWEAVGRRFQRNYIWLITLLILSWAIKLSVHPTSADGLTKVVERAAIGFIPGIWVIGFVAALYAALGALAIATLLSRARLRISLAAPRWLRERLWWATQPPAGKPEPKVHMATIITGRGEQVSWRILSDLGRGVTALEGTGMYTGEPRDVLLCAVARTQIPRLEEAVRQVDPEAFVIVSSAVDVRVRGFPTFEAPS